MPEVQAAFIKTASSWTPPTGILGELTRAAQVRASLLAPHAAEIEQAAAVRTTPAGAFVDALRSDTAVAVIAELKRRSPSKGAINESMSLGERAEHYAKAGARALSVLTEPTAFGGSLDDLALVAGRVDCPLLRKDFIVDRLQLVEARANGASAVLLIARALHPGAVERLAAEARALGLDVLLEVRDERELEFALTIPDCAIGVNNRNLETLEIDAATGARLLPLVPRSHVAICESGIVTRGDVEAAAAAGADAVLVGSALSAAPDGYAAAMALMNVPRKRDARAR